MDTLLDMINSLGIQLEITSALPRNVNGFYYKDDIHDIIVINNALKNEAEFRTVLSHELGHYFTTGGSFKVNAFMDLIHTERDEVRAIRWACDYLIPNDLLISKLREVSEMPLQSLADYFEVSIELMKMKFYFMSLISPKWQLDGSKILLLSALPSIYVVEPSFDLLEVTGAMDASDTMDATDAMDDEFWCSEKVEMYLQGPACHSIKVVYRIT